MSKAIKAFLNCKTTNNTTVSVERENDVYMLYDDHTLIAITECMHSYILINEAVEKDNKVLVKLLDTLKKNNDPRIVKYKPKKHLIQCMLNNSTF